MGTTKPHAVEALEPLVDLLAERVAAKRPPMEHHLSAALGWVSLAVLGAELLGSTAPGAGADWCKRHGVPYRRDGKHNFARLEDVRRALEGLEPHAPRAAPQPQRERVAGLVDRVVGGRG